MDTQKFDKIRETVVRSFETLHNAEFSFLGERKLAVLSRMPYLLDILEKIHSGLIGGKARDPWIDFWTDDADCFFPSVSRHCSVRLRHSLPKTGKLSIGIVQGSFDPFHLGHLLMGLDAVADGSCDFTLFVPNADNSLGGKSRKPHKSAHPWRMRTVFEGGVDDFYPVTRLSPFGLQGDNMQVFSTLVERNRPRIDELDELEFIILIGSDVVMRSDFVEWTNDAYGRVESLRDDGKIKIRFRVVERSRDESTESLLEKTAGLKWPVTIVPELSCASSSAIRNDPVGAMYLYPRSITLLEAFLLYGQGKLASWRS